MNDFVRKSISIDWENPIRRSVRTSDERQQYAKDIKKCAFFACLDFAQIDFVCAHAFRPNQFG